MSLCIYRTCAPACLCAHTCISMYSCMCVLTPPWPPPVSRPLSPIIQASSSSSLSPDPCHSLGTRIRVGHPSLPSLAPENLCSAARRMALEAERCLQLMVSPKVWRGEVLETRQDLSLPLCLPPQPGQSAFSAISCPSADQAQRASLLPQPCRKVGQLCTLQVQDLVKQCLSLN